MASQWSFCSVGVTVVSEVADEPIRGANLLGVTVSLPLAGRMNEWSKGSNMEETDFTEISNVAIRGKTFIEDDTKVFNMIYEGINGAATFCHVYHLKSWERDSSLSKSISSDLSGLKRRETILSEPGMYCKTLFQLTISQLATTC